MLNLVVVNLASSGFYEGRKAWFRPGQSLAVGSSQLADLVVPFDNQIEDIHCEITCDRECCTVRSTGDGRVLVNNAPVTTATLHDGDRITIGTTTLTVEVEHRGPVPTTAATKNGPEPATEPPADSRELVGAVAPDSSDRWVIQSLERWLS